MSARLNVIIRLLLDHFKTDDKQTVGDKIVFLESAGLESRDIAMILNIEVNQLTSYRRSARKKPKGEIEEPPAPAGVQA